MHSGVQNLFLVCLQPAQQLQHAIRKLGQQTSDQLFVYTKTDEKDTPSALALYGAGSAQQNLEQVISNTLKTVSVKQSPLQQAGILPNKLPAPLLEAAMNSSEASEVIGGSPTY